MKCIKTEIPDVIIFSPRVFEDNRGYFFESYNKKLFQNIGIIQEFIQDNQSYSKYGTVRGLHFQKGSDAQAKLIRVISGRILDVSVDIRASSPTFGKFVSHEISSENYQQILVPRGFAHGFSVLSDHAIIEYKCDNYYNKESESSILYNDQDLNIDWLIEEKKILISDKDKLGLTFEEYKQNPCF